MKSGPVAMANDWLEAGAGRLSAWGARLWGPLGADQRPPLSRWWHLGWALPLVLQLVHTGAVAPLYHVGSFDDDGNYLMAAHVLASGGGLTAIMPSGARVVSLYLAGYPAMLVPFIWVFGNSLWVPRALSTVCVALLYPLMWSWLGRRGLKPGFRVAVLAVLALNPVLATYSTMAMAEAPFLLLFMLTVSCVGAWERRPGVPLGAVVAVLLASLTWVKEAGIGLTAGVALYFLWRRRWWATVGVSTGVGLVLAPGIAARLATGNSALGDRYASDLSNSVQGGVLSQLPPEIAHNVWSYLSTALRESVVPVGSPLPGSGTVYLLEVAVASTVPIFMLVGAVVWYRRHPRAETWMAGTYLIETLAYPYVNQRRVMLVLPIVVLWYTVGAATLGGQALAWARRAVASRPAVAARRVVTEGPLALALPAGAAVVVVVALLPLTAQFSRDYMFKQGEQSSQWARSPAVNLLKQLGSHQDVVETDFRGSVAFFTGHRTAWSAFTTTNRSGPFAYSGQSRCQPPLVGAHLAADQAKFLLVGDVDGPFMDSPCLLSLATRPATARSLGAVRLLASRSDQESVFELLGPGTGQPSLEDPTAGKAPAGAVAERLPRDGYGDGGGTAYRRAAHQGTATFTWTWGHPVSMTQVSVGTVTSTGPISQVSVYLGSASAGGTAWHLVNRAAGPVGDGDRDHYLLADPRPGLVAGALRVSVATTGTAEVAYANAVGTPLSVTPRPSRGIR